MGVGGYVVVGLKQYKCLTKLGKGGKKLRNLKEEEGEEEEEGNKGTVGKIVPKNLDIIHLEITEKPVKPKICAKLCKLV